MKIQMRCSYANIIRHKYANAWQSSLFFHGSLKTLERSSKVSKHTSTTLGILVCLCVCVMWDLHTQQQNERQMEGAPFFACLCLVRNQSWDFKGPDFAKVNNHRALNKPGAEVDIMRPSIIWPHRIEWPRSEEWSLPLAFNSKLTPNGTRVRAYRAAGGT